MNVMNFYGIDFSKKSKRLSRCSGYWGLLWSMLTADPCCGLCSLMSLLVGYAHWCPLLWSVLTADPCCGLRSLMSLAVGYVHWLPLLWATLTDVLCCGLCLLKSFAVGSVHWLPLLRAMFIEDLTPHSCGSCPLAVPFLQAIISIICCHGSSNPQESSTVKSMCISFSLKIKG